VMLPGLTHTDALPGYHRHTRAYAL
jgi:hypothetical protein